MYYIIKIVTKSGKIYYESGSGKLVQNPRGATKFTSIASALQYHDNSYLQSEHGDKLEWCDDAQEYMYSVHVVRYVREVHAYAVLRRKYD